MRLRSRLRMRNVLVFLIVFLAAAPVLASARIASWDHLRPSNDIEFKDPIPEKETLNVKTKTPTWDATWE